jgi:hypothetical protein
MELALSGGRRLVFSRPPPRRTAGCERITVGARAPRACNARSRLTPVYCPGRSAALSPVLRSLRRPTAPSRNRRRLRMLYVRSRESSGASSGAPWHSSPCSSRRAVRMRSLSVTARSPAGWAPWAETGRRESPATPQVRTSEPGARDDAGLRGPPGVHGDSDRVPVRRGRACQRAALLPVQLNVRRGILRGRPWLAGAYLSNCSAKP